MLNTSKPIYADLKDRGKTDPYHRDMSAADLAHMELLKYAEKYPGVFTADDLLSIIEAMEDPYGQ